MKKGICAIVFFIMFCFQFGCGTGNESEKARPEKDKVEKVGDAAGTIGYDGKAIEKGLREVNNQAKDRDKAADDIFNE